MADKEDVYCTLVLNDAYLPGAAVLAHSLRDAGTTKKLACLLWQQGLRESTITELRTLYNHVIPVEPIGNPNPANLYLMNRPDLLYTFTKIHLWAQTQFRKVLYIDADVVALRAPEELFDIPDSFAAAPDVGWPDAFNTGVMLISPHMGDYHALRGLANTGDSFDGADQGLLNQYYEHRPWKRISFTYNTTPSANYQYEPAYRYFKRDISLVHFIGAEKPWQRGRSAPGSPNAFQEMLSRWWAVYDRHFHISTTDYIHGAQNVVTHYVHQGQNHQAQHQAQVQQSYSATGYPVASTGPAPPPHELPRHDIVFHQPQWHDHSHQHQKHGESQHHHVPFREHHAHGTATPLMTEPGERAENIQQGHIEPTPTVEQRKFSAPHMEWDATRGAPPVESKPEAANFPTQTYEFNTNLEPFRAPQAYPEPPKDMWYTVPEKPKPAEKPKPIFPWEEREAPRPTRRFIDDEPPPPLPALEADREPYADELEVTSDSNFEPVTPTIRISGDPFAFAATKNAWDDVAGIEHYVRALTSFHRSRGQVQVLQQNEITSPETSQAAQTQQHILSPSNKPGPEELIEEVQNRRESLLLTHFPSAVERPSLPVTPAPRRRPTFWGEERDDEGELPGAEGVPSQADWDPTTQLEQLRRNSLIGPGDLKMPEKILAKRKMPSSAAAIPEGALSYPHVPVADHDGASDVVTQTDRSGGSGPIFREPDFNRATATRSSESRDVLSPTTSGQPFYNSGNTTVNINEASTTEQSKEILINTAINSAASDVTAADKAAFSKSGFDRPPADTVSAAVGVDEVDMKELKTPQEAAGK